MKEKIVLRNIADMKSHIKELVSERFSIQQELSDKDKDIKSIYDLISYEINTKLQDTFNLPDKDYYAVLGHKKPNIDIHYFQFWFNFC